MKTLIVMMMVAIVVLSAGVSNAALYETSFETSDGFVDDTGINGIDGWVSGTSCTSNDHSNYAHSGTLGLRIADNNSFYRDFTASQNVVADFWSFPVDTNGMHFQLNEGSTTGAQVYFGGGYVHAYDGADVVELVALDHSLWNNIKIVADTASDTYDVYVNTVLKADDYSFRNNLGTIDRFRGVRTSTNRVGFDDLTITPEPATMTLLLLGLPLALRRRR